VRLSQDQITALVGRPANATPQQPVPASGRGTVLIASELLTGPTDYAASVYLHEIVLGQWSYIRIGDDYREAPFPALPHSSKRQHSPMNLQRRIQDLNRSACFVWYSAKTVANGRASVMIYNIGAKRVECWFAAFNRRDGWKVQQTKGVSRDDVERLVEVSSS